MYILIFGISFICFALYYFLRGRVRSIFRYLFLLLSIALILLGYFYQKNINRDLVIYSNLNKIVFKFPSVYRKEKIPNYGVSFNSLADKCKYHVFISELGLDNNVSYLKNNYELEYTNTVLIEEDQTIIYFKYEKIKNGMKYNVYCKAIEIDELMIILIVEAMSDCSMDTNDYKTFISPNIKERHFLFRI